MGDTEFAQEATFFEHALPVGAVLSDNQFKITGHLGAGGFGITYRAQDNVLGRTVVIKECFPEDFCMREGKTVIARGQSYAKALRSIVKLFMREARSLAKLRHPNIVGVHGAFEEHQTAYMVLDLIDGQDLLDILTDNSAKLSPKRVRSILVQLLDAIENVHSVGLLHRDIAPDNIIIEKSGTPVLIDFGAARADASSRTRAISSMLVVKDGYSPHEFYVAGSEQTPSSDLYALAATFYHILTGEVPPHSQTRMVEIAGEKPDPYKPLAGRVSGYDDDFLSAIDQCLKIHPKDRLQSAGQWRALIANSEAEAGLEDHSEPSLPSNVINLELERSLNKLVTETNVEVKKSQVVQVAPVPEKPVKKEQARPNWVDEFNEETKVLEAQPDALKLQTLEDGAELRASDQGSGGSGGGDAETNWIERAQDKVHRTWVASEISEAPDQPKEELAAPPEDQGDEVMVSEIEPEAFEEPPSVPPRNPVSFFEVTFAAMVFGGVVFFLMTAL